MARQIGSQLGDQHNTLGRVAHKLAHGASAAGFAAAGAAVLGQDAGSAAIGGAMGAMTAEIVADLLVEPINQDVFTEVQKQQAETGEPLTQQQKQEIFQTKVRDVGQIAKLTGAISGLLTGSAQGISAAQSYGDHAIENNFWQTFLVGGYAAYAIYEEFLNNQPMEDGIQEVHIIDDLLLMGGPGAAKGAKKIASKIAPVVEKEATQAARILGNEVGAVGV